MRNYLKSLNSFALVFLLNPAIGFADSPASSNSPDGSFPSPRKAPRCTAGRERCAKIAEANRLRQLKKQRWCKKEPEKCRQLRERRQEIGAKAKQRCRDDPQACLSREKALQQRQKQLSEYIRSNNALSKRPAASVND